MRSKWFISFDFWIFTAWKLNFKYFFFDIQLWPRILVTISSILSFYFPSLNSFWLWIFIDGLDWKKCQEQEFFDCHHICLLRLYLRFLISHALLLWCWYQGKDHIPHRHAYIQTNLEVIAMILLKRISQIPQMIDITFLLVCNVGSICINHVGWNSLTLLCEGFFIQLFKFLHLTFHPTFHPTMLDWRLDSFAPALTNEQIIRKKLLKDEIEISITNAGHFHSRKDIKTIESGRWKNFPTFHRKSSVRVADGSIWFSLVVSVLTFLILL